MLLTIDNLDGQGPRDYTACIDTSQPFEVRRALNEPSIVKGPLCLAGSSLPVPARRGRVMLQDASGSVLFTGYLTTEPAPVYAGEASQGSVYRLAVSAVSDEWLLDKQSFGSVVGPAVGDTGLNLLTALANRVDAGLLTTSGPANGRAVGVVEPALGAKWSETAGAIAGAAYTTYRAIGGNIGLGGLMPAQHTLSGGAGSLQIAALQVASLKELANDVTVTGGEEPHAYWTEFFLGDGTTSVFPLLGEPASPNAGHGVLLSDPFNEPSLDLQRWQLADPGAYVSLSQNGLHCHGGTGADGQTSLTAWDAVELGGSIVIELDTVTLASGSAGVLGGLYTGSVLQANCLAGFQIRQAGGQTLATPLVNGVEVGTSLTVVPGHSYTMHLRLFCPELLRLRQPFYAYSDLSGTPSIAQFGSGFLAAPLSLVFDARDNGTGSSTPLTVLYDGPVATSPAQARFAAINSLTLNGSIGAIQITRTGSCLIRSTSPAGTTWTRLIGKAAGGTDCSVTSSPAGHVTFFNGRVPGAGETVAVSYRGRQRAVARVADPASLAAEAAGGAVGSARWFGHVLSPPARSQEDCENAAQAILSFAANRAAALSGTCLAVSPPAPDIWPGDLLVLATGSETLRLIVRRVTVSAQGASPEALTYHIAFANDWAEGLGIKLSESIAKDALLPDTAIDLIDSPTGANLPVHVLSNLQQITVTGPSAGALTVDAGIDPPPGGGFEVRRRDGGFGMGSAGTSSGDLVLRSPTRSFSLPVSATPETFFLRMYDASTPPLYSRFSAAILNQKPGS